MTAATTRPYDFIAHVSRTCLRLHAADDPEGVTIQMHKWGRGGDQPTAESLLTGERDEAYGGVDIVEAERGVLIDGSTAVPGMGTAGPSRDGPTATKTYLGFEGSRSVPLRWTSTSMRNGLGLSRMAAPPGTSLLGLEAWDAEGRALEADGACRPA